MAYDEHLAQHIRDLAKGRPEITEKKMFGGICFFLNGNMLCGVEVGRYMFRVGKEQEGEALKKTGASRMDLTGRPMGGLVHVTEDACHGAKLAEWLATAERFVVTLPAKKEKK
jgi:hypothetical protein